MSKSNNTIKGTLVYKQFIATDDGQEVQVRYNQKPELYQGTDVTLFEYTAKETVDGIKTDVTKYAVPVEQAIRATRTAKADSILADALAGMSAKDLEAKYGKR